MFMLRNGKQRAFMPRQPLHTSPFFHIQLGDSQLIFRPLYSEQIFVW